MRLLAHFTGDETSGSFYRRWDFRLIFPLLSSSAPEFRDDILSYLINLRYPTADCFLQIESQCYQPDWIFKTDRHEVKLNVTADCFVLLWEGMFVYSEIAHTHTHTQCCESSFRPLRKQASGVWKQIAVDYIWIQDWRKRLLENVTR